jgi:hypothetical protein
MKPDKYHVTGVDVYGKRFKIITTNWYHADGINLFNGSVWAVDTKGRRKLVKRVKNG